MILVLTAPGGAAAQESPGQRAVPAVATGTRSAEGQQAYPLGTLRWMEDWSYLGNRKRADLTPYERLKHIPLDAGEVSYLSLGAEARARLEIYDKPLFGMGPGGARDFASGALRWLAHADVHAGPHARGFVQLGVFKESGRKPVARPPDRGRLDLHQGFIDLSGRVGDGETSLALRLGRQQLAYGTGRLLSIRDATSIQRAFDGARLGISKPGLVTAHVIAARPVGPRRGSFDDKGSGAERLWGAYSTWQTGKVIGLPFDTDLYFLRRERDAITFIQGTAGEIRNTVGSRLFGRRGAIDFNMEGAVQFGSFGRADLFAWGFAFDGGYSAASLMFAPRFGLKVDIASGDDDPNDGRLGTFDALYPALDYYSTAAIYGPTNGVDVQPSVRLNWTKRFWTQFGINLFWRLEAKDALYAPSGAPIVRPEQSRAHFAGALASCDVVWMPTPFLEIRGALVYGVAGKAVRDAGGRDQLFELLQIGTRF